jgi:predicted nucleic acid-binding protein
MTSELPVYVLDASVGVKWFKPEAGQEAALGLLRRAVDGEILLAAPVQFAHEVLSVVRRQYSAADIVPAWEWLHKAGVAQLPLNDEVIAAAAAQCDLLGCTFYDALAPACASLLGAILASSDVRAHGAYPGVVVVE